MNIIANEDFEHINPQAVLNGFSGPSIIVRKNGSVIYSNKAFKDVVDVGNSQYIEEFLKSGQPSQSIVALVERSQRISGELPAQVQYKGKRFLPKSSIASFSMLKSVLTNQPYAILIQLKPNQNKIDAFLKRISHTTHQKNSVLRKAKNDSVTDPLTKLSNRRAIEKVLSIFFELFDRNATPCSVIIVDIDHFKFINDNYGHDKGDEVLVVFSSLLLSLARESDSVGRWGGEEFIIVLPETNSVEAAEFLNRVHQKTSSVGIKTKQKIVKFTFSAGVSQFRDGDDIASMLARADEALYSAKEAGRNRFRIRV